MYKVLVIWMVVCCIAPARASKGMGMKMMTREPPEPQLLHVSKQEGLALAGRWHLGSQIFAHNLHHHVKGRAQILPTASSKEAAGLISVGALC